MPSYDVELEFTNDEIFQAIGIDYAEHTPMGVVACVDYVGPEHEAETQGLVARGPKGRIDLDAIKHRRLRDFLDERVLADADGQYHDDSHDRERDDWDDDDFLIDGVGFADPGGRPALRAATRSNPRNLPCPRCGEPDRLTPADQARGYQCDSCADRAEAGYDY